jgi:23S rRNA pseudouridine1911/1915/1917 synthase
MEQERLKTESLTGIVNVLYEDNHIIAVLKPAGIPVQKGGRKQSLDLVVKDYLKKKYKKPGNVFLGIVHRLDQPVSGIILFAKTSKGASRLSEQFREKELEKTYRAVLVGKLKNKRGILKSRIRKEKGGYFRAVIDGPAYGEPQDKKGKEAELEYKIVKEGAKNSLVEIKLGTGRFHQIRAQFSSIGHPVLGDVKYGSPMVLPGGKIALHSSKITFVAATGDRKVELAVSDPAYFKELL